MKSVRLLLTALTLTAVAALVPAAPVDATVLNTGTFIGGSAILNTTPPFGILLSEDYPAPCPDPFSPPTMGVDVTSSGGSWTTAMASFDVNGTGVSFTWNGGTTSRMSLGAVTGTGTIGAGPGYAVSQSMSVAVNFHDTSSCVTGAAKCASAVITVTLTGNLIGAGISGETIQSGTVAVLGGVGTLVAVGCTPPYSSLNGKSVTFRNVVLTY